MVTEELLERTVTLLLSRDTAALWDALAARMELTFAELVQVLTLYGAFLMASADSGYLEGLDLADLTPEAMRAVFVPWLESQSARDREAPEQ